MQSIQWRRVFKLHRPSRNCDFFENTQTDTVSVSHVTVAVPMGPLPTPGGTELTTSTVFVHSPVSYIDLGVVPWQYFLEIYPWLWSIFTNLHLYLPFLGQLPSFVIFVETLMPTTSIGLVTIWMLNRELYDIPEASDLVLLNDVTGTRLYSNGSFLPLNLAMVPWACYHVYVAISWQ